MKTDYPDIKENVDAFIRSLTDICQILIDRLSTLTESRFTYTDSDDTLLKGEPDQ